MTLTTKSGKEIPCVDTGLMIPVDDLLPYAKNARKHTKDDLRTIENSIMEFGFDDPPGIWGGCKHDS